jgi:hypothetical protein
VATQVSTAAKAGAPHGAATIPDVAPSRNTAGYEPPPRLPAQPMRRVGMGTGTTSSSASPKTASNRAIPPSAQGLDATVPKSEPVSPATTPSSA